MSIDQRLQQLTDWVRSERPSATLAPASADASFRRYFRVLDSGNSWIAMDAPPEKESLDSFIDITHRLLQADIQAPDIHQQSLEHGFLLLSDLGSTPYLDVLTPNTADAMYHDAVTALVKVQQADINGLPAYDEALLQQEMSLFPEWFLGTHLGITLSEAEQADLNDIFNRLVQSAQQQPQVFVHRDYHSRNLMVTEQQNPGVIDYQDAVLGPVTYDLVSLLRDCYIAWPEHQVRAWVKQYQDLATEQNILEAVDTDTFYQWFDWMGLQRHLKVLGIFARLSHRDGKQAYLNDLPLTLSYVLSVAKRYPEMASLVALFERYDIPQRIGTVELSA
jgi:aminoglycoside/choline kinase family phosphotransferase